MSDHEIGRSKAGDDRRLSDQETNQRLRSLLTPLVNDLLRTTPAPRHDPTRRVHPPGHDPSSTPSTIPSCNHTDLPLPQSGSSGRIAAADNGRRQSTAAELMEALDRMLLVPVAPPLHEVDPQVVLRWAEAASEALLYRRERRWLVRQVLRVLEEEWATSQEIERLHDQIAAREEEQRQREQGAYWERRESGRRAQRPIRVEVDPEAWTRAKGAARREGLGIGEYVGKLITAEVGRRRDYRSVARLTHAHRRRTPSRERFFARVAVDRETWTEFVASSHEARVTVARHVGVLVETAIDEPDTHLER